MAISQEDQKVLGAVFGEEVATKISGAISEEMSLGLRLNGKILSPEEQQQIKDTAVQQGKELGYKEIAKAAEIKLEAGEKNPVTIAEKLKADLSAIYELKYKNQTPTEETIALAKKAGEFEDKYKTVLETLKQKETEAIEWQTKYTEKEKAIREEQLNNKILASFPDKMNQDKADALLIARNSIQFEEVDGKLVAKQGGKIITDNIGEPEPIENVIKSFVEKKGWTKTGGMGGSDRGGNNDLGGGKSTYSPDEALQLLKSKNISPTSPEGLKAFTALTKDYKKK